MADRHRDRNTAVASGSGTATFLLPAPPSGSTLTGSIGVAEAGSSSAFVAVIGGVTWGAWGGNATFGPVQQWPTETISVTATGLTPGARYTLTFIGMVQPEQSTEIIWPSAIATALSTTSVSVPAFHGARIVTTAAHSIPDSATTTIVWDASTIDSDGYFDNPNDRFVVPAGLAGTYRFDLFVLWTNGTVAAAAFAQFLFALNGATLSVPQSLVRFEELSPGNRQSTIVSGVLGLAVGDTIAWRVFQNTGVAVNLDGAAADTSARCFSTLTLLGV